MRSVCVDHKHGSRERSCWLDVLSSITVEIIVVLVSGCTSNGRLLKKCVIYYEFIIAFLEFVAESHVEVNGFSRNP